MSTLNVNNINEVGGVDAVITAGVLDSGSLPAGSIIAIESVSKTDTFSAAGVAAGGSIAVTDLSITYELSSASNKLLIMAFFGQAAQTNRAGNVGIAVHDGTNLISIGDAAGSSTRVTAGGFVAAGSNRIVTMPHIHFLHSPGAGSKTYSVHALNIANGSNTIYVNRNEENNTAESLTPRGVSVLTLMEVAA